MNKSEAQPIEQRFLASVSHEIRTPLNGILGMASLLAETELTPAQADYVSAIRRSGARLLDLLNNVLDYARMDATGVELEVSETDIRSLAQDVAELLSPRAHEKGLDICIRTSTSLPPRLALDDGRVRQILFNIVGNAIKFTEDGGVLIDMAFNENTSELQIDIIDSGAGLSEDAQSRLFDAFEQAEAGHRGIDGGVGLGLSIVKRLVDAMDGSVTIFSAPGMGARFRVTLPAEAVAFPKTAKTRTDKHLRIGLAGMSPPLQLSLAAMAQKAGHTALIGAGEVDVWLVDAQLPPSEIKRLTESAPVLALIRPEDRDHIENLRGQGCSGYLMRPVRESSLLERLNLSGSQTSVANDELEPDHAGSVGRVLIADDNAVNALLATRILEKAGYSCATAATGAEALEAVQMSEFSIVLMDLRMPVMDGFEAMRQIRALPTAKNTMPIIAISAEINPDVEKAARAAGADAVAAKPLDAHTLRSIVERWTTRQKAHS